ncbi:hypothetical protein RD792_003142 [Penstemon davidsonii]|uniref:Protein kinase domain-containing protein n=1 Tax=Penstemon davidsonii TaxID=160366 RepID=A0ABR0DU01_9LAMI|nr:hypothetical protein RD792_003142 [Penstemon davidsonii]
MSGTTPWDVPSPPSPDDFLRQILIYSLISSLIFLAIIGVISWYCAKKIRRGLPELEFRAALTPAAPAPGAPVQVMEMDAPTMEKFFQELAQEKPVRFTAQQLYTFTENYSTMLGSGSFGKVYKGQFPGGVKIAVKVLNRGLKENIEEQFMAEVGTIGRTHHINLVRLYGFCYDHVKIESFCLGSRKFLIYQAISRYHLCNKNLVGESRYISRNPRIVSG